MLGLMRKYSESFLIYLIFGAIIVVFAINFGPGSGSCRRAGPGTNYAATVDGEPILAQEFALNYSYRLELQRQRMRMANMELTNEMLEQMGLRKQVIDELVDQKLLAQEARRWGLTVGDEQLLEYMKLHFPVEKLEDPRQYESWVARNFETTVQRFESDRRGEILGQEIHQVLMQNVDISDDELESDYLREHDRAMATFVRFDSTSVAVPDPTPAEIEQLLADDFPAVEHKYNTELLKYRTPPQVHLRQIFKKLATDASAAEVAKARSFLLDLKSQLDSGADFAALAKEHSEDESSAPNGGDLGFVQRGQLPASVEDMAFALKKDQISKDPIQSPDGMHLLQVVEAKPPERRKLEEVKQEVAEELVREQKAKAIARAEAEQFLAELSRGKALDELTVAEQESTTAEATEKPVRRDTPWILRTQQNIARIGQSQEVHDEIFSLTLDQPVSPEVHEVNNGFFVIVLKDRETPDLKKFESEKENLRQYAISVKQNRLHRAWVQHLRSLAQIEYNQGLFPPQKNPADNG